jgi:ABC-type multidrug transport system fused ATPase/permease subunit
MKTLQALWQLLDARQRRRFVLLQGVSLIVACFTIAGVAALAPFLMVLTDPALIERHAILTWLYAAGGFGSRAGFVLALGGAFVLMVVAGNLLTLLGTHLLTRFSLDVGDEFHAALLAEYLHRDYVFHAREGSSALFNKVVHCVNRVATGVIEGGMLVLANAMTVLLIIAATLVVNPAVAGVATLWIGGCYFASYALARRRLYRNGALEAELIMARARFASESLGAIHEVKVYGAQGYFSRGFENACRGISRVVASNHAIGHAPRHALEIVTVAALVAAAVLVSRGRSTAGWLTELAFLGFAAYRMLPAIQGLFIAVVRVRANVPLFEEVCVDLRSALHRSRRPAGPDRASPALRGELQLDEVSLQYEGAARPALASVSARIPAGALVGIVGANGSGKSTLLALVLGLLRPTHGCLRVDGIELDAGNLHAWQRHIAYVPQRISLLDATLAENIAFGVPRRQIDDARLARCIRLARLDSLVSRLPAGSEQRIGQDGQMLSGGERQRVAIARALYRDAHVMVMDEATSALDGLTEREILEMLQELRGTYTILFVAHRPMVIRECDQVILLDSGELAAIGEYATLAASSALFRRMMGMGAMRSASGRH